MKRYILTNHPRFKLEIYDTLENKLFVPSFPSFICIYGNIKTTADSEFLGMYKIAESDNLEELYERICIEEL